MKTIRNILAICLLLGSVYASATVLNVPQIYQTQTQWCWAATSQAMLQYYGYYFTQNEIAQYGTDGANEWNWLWGSTTNPTRRGIDLIMQYFANLSTSPYGRSLSLAESASFIDADRPFYVRWGWDSGGGHFLVAHGVESSTMYLMDPWYGPTINSYAWTLSGGGHTWTHSLTMNTAPYLEPVTALQITSSLSTVQLSWNPVIRANSYLVYSAAQPDPADWGTPCAIVSGTGCTLDAGTSGKGFYRVVASSDLPPARD
ncbi:MAG TPA: C39 family peptidase [Candidatus Cloacimonadota bacterium]|nr:C39 family peptidase [Candidatus Cloacimonadota bacterium]